MPLQAEFDTHPRTTIIVQNGQENIPVGIGDGRLFLSCNPNGTLGSLREGDVCEKFVSNLPGSSFESPREVTVLVGEHKRGEKKGQPRNLKVTLRLASFFWF